MGQGFFQPLQWMGVVDEAGNLAKHLEYPRFQRPGPLRQLIPELTPPAPQGAFIRLRRSFGELATITQVAQDPLNLYCHVMLEGKQEFRQTGKGLLASGTMESPYLGPFLDSVNNRPAFADSMPVDFRAAEKAFDKAILWRMG